MSHRRWEEPQSLATPASFVPQLGHSEQTECWVISKMASIPVPTTHFRMLIGLQSSPDIQSVILHSVPNFLPTPPFYSCPAVRLAEWGTVVLRWLLYIKLISVLTPRFGILRSRKWCVCWQQHYLIWLARHDSMQPGLICRVIITVPTSNTDYNHLGRTIRDPGQNKMCTCVSRRYNHD